MHLYSSPYQYTAQHRFQRGPVDHFINFKTMSIEELAGEYLNNISSLGINFKFPFFEQAINATKFLRQNRWTEQQIIEKINRELTNHGYDPFSVRRVYQKSFGRPLEDDFALDNIFAVKKFNQGTVQVTVGEALDGVVEGTIVQFSDEDWQVLDHNDSNYILKKLKD